MVASYPKLLHTCRTVIATIMLEPIQDRWADKGHMAYLELDLAYEGRNAQCPIPKGSCALDSFHC